MDPTNVPIARALFADWRRIRGERLPSQASTRPFSRSWEELLERAGAISAEDRRAAEHEIRALADEQWVVLKSVRYRPHLIDLIQIPLASEDRWRAAFGFAPGAVDEDAQAIREFEWASELKFVRDARIAIPFADLKRIHEFLPGSPRALERVPVKERSLEIFGDEKRLDALIATALFREDRLTLPQLGCEEISTPLGWHRGAAPKGPVIVIENASTWHSYRRWDQAQPQFSAIVYGQGMHFAENARGLGEIFRELGSERPVFYFGDIDATGLRIPARAAEQLRRANLPPAEPHWQSYEWLLEFGAAKSSPANPEDPARLEDCAWLGPLSDRAWAILSGGRRLPQEHIGWSFLNRRRN